MKPCSATRNVPDQLNEKFFNFPTILKKNGVTRNDIGDYMKTYAAEIDLLKQPQRMLISNIH